MTADLTPSEAKRIHVWADRELGYLRDPVIWLGTEEEWKAAIADCESISAKCEAVIRSVGQWEAHAERMERIRKNR